MPELTSQLPDFIQESVFLELAEIWKPIDGYKGYDVSSFGRVRTWSGKGRPGMSVPYVLKLHLNTSSRQNRYYARLFDGTETKHVRVSKLVAKHFLPEQPSDQHEIRHWDGNALNDRASNLLWGTAKENSADMLRHGTRMKGTQHWSTSLTVADIQAIRTRYISGETQKAIAQDYLIGQDEVSRIVNRKRWASVD